MHFATHEPAAQLRDPGSITAKLARAGPAFVLPDLIQNIRDRPDDEVNEFFAQLKLLPDRPGVEALRQVFSWYQGGFLEGLDYESDPVSAWAECGLPTCASLRRAMPCHFPALTPAQSMERQLCEMCMQATSVNGYAAYVSPRYSDRTIVRHLVMRAGSTHSQRWPSRAQQKLVCRLERMYMVDEVEVQVGPGLKPLKHWIPDETPSLAEELQDTVSESTAHHQEAHNSVQLTADEDAGGTQPEDSSSALSLEAAAAAARRQVEIDCKGRALATGARFATSSLCWKVLAWLPFCNERRREALQADNLYSVTVATDPNARSCRDARTTTVKQRARLTHRSLTHAGRRKESSARVWVSFGAGDFSVNGRPFGAYFAKSAHRSAALLPLTAAAGGAPAAYTVRALVEGGGAPSLPPCYHCNVPH